MKKKFNLKISVFQLLILITMVPYLKPRLLQYNSFINTIFNLLTYVNYLIVLVVLFYNKRRPSFYTISIAVFYFWEIIVAQINGVSLSSSINEFFLYVSLLLLCEIYLQKNALLFMKTVCGYMFFLIFVNFFYQILIGESGYTDATGNVIYFWQTRNHMASLFIAAISLLFITVFAQYGKITFFSILLSGFVIFNMFFLKSSTGIVGVVTAVLLCLYWIWHPKSRLLRYDVLLIIGIGMNILIVLLRVQDIFSWLIVDILHRDLTFTSRTYIWDQAFELIKARPWFGYGEGARIFISFISKFNLIAHNQILEFMVVGGIPGGILSFLPLCTLHRHFSREQSIYQKILMAAIFSWLIMMVTECVTPYQPWYILCCCACYLHNLPKPSQKRSVIKITLKQK